MTLSISSPATSLQDSHQGSGECESHTLSEYIWRLKRRFFDYIRICRDRDESACQDQHKGNRRRCRVQGGQCSDWNHFENERNVRATHETGAGVVAKTAAELKSTLFTKCWIESKSASQSLLHRGRGGWGDQMFLHPTNVEWPWIPHNLKPSWNIESEFYCSLHADIYI